MKINAANKLQKIQDYTINLGDSVQLEVYYKQLPPSINWYPPDSLSCQDCINPYASPVTDTYYTLYTFSKDGCPDSVKIFVRVLKDKRLWAPNVFSPNGDAINDKFKIFGTEQVVEVNRLQIFSRWGELIYENFNFDINDATIGWNGEFKGKPMNPGVFVYLA
jgi:gliding motility-associated-like protein